MNERALAADEKLSVIELYYRALERRGFQSDPAQLRAVERLQQLYEEWSQYKARRSSALRRLVVYPPLPRGVHRELEELKGREDPLAALAGRIAKRYRLICFDEMHINDIADAMIIGRLLARIMDLGVVCCMTSNYRPDELYKDGLKRENFLPTIALLKERLDVLHVDGGIDYRQRMLEGVRTYHAPLGAEADRALMEAFKRIAEVEEEFHELDVEGRVI